MRLLLVLTLAGLACGLAAPQAPAGGAARLSLSGRVRSSGLAIPGATITATQGANRGVTTTDEEGRYQFADLAPGDWAIKVEMLGFSASERRVAVSNEPASADIDLTLLPPVLAPAPEAARRGGFRNANLNAVAGSTTAEANAVPVPGAPAVTDPASANEAFLMNGTVSSGLAQPVPPDEGMGRPGMEPGGFGPSPFGQGQPGFGQGGQAGSGPGAGPGGFGGGMGPGGRMGPGGGMGPRGPMGMGPGGARRPGFDRAANFGNRARRGRGRIRGSAFFGLGNSVFDARPYSLTGQTVEKSSYAQSRFGFNLGGALRIPKIVNSERTFFFINYTGTRARSPFSAVATVPTDLERAGDFSQSVSRGQVLIYEPLTNQPFPGNRIPASRIDPAARGLLAFIPAPNQPGLVQNYQYVTSTANNGDNLGVRLNHSLSDKDSLNFNMNLQRRDSTNAQTYGFLDSGDGLGSSIRLGWTHNLSARTINALSFDFSRNSNETVPYFAYGANVAAELGIAGVSNDPINYGPPNLSFTNFGALSDASPLLQRNQTSRVSDALTLVRGTHTVTMGGEYRRMQINTRTDQNARGTFTFSGLATSALDASGHPVNGTGFDLADLLLGLPQSSSIRFGDSSTYFRAPAFGAYIQDDWRARSNLSLNVGLRYEFFQPFTEKYDHIANLDIAPGFTGVAVVVPGAVGPYSGKFPSGLIDSDPRMFSPRAGIAWRPFPSHQLQVRAGYGIYYNGSIYNQFPSRLAAQPPFASSASLVTSLDNPLTIANGFAAAPTETITNTYAVDRGYRPGYAQTWNVAIQTELPHAFVLEAGYLGIKGTRLDVERLPNRAAPGSPLTAEQRRLIGNATGFILDTSDGNSISHAAQLRLMRRFSGGVSVNALYSYAKSIDDASTLGGGAAVVAQNDQDLSAERGLSSFDQRHTLNLFFMLASPVGGRSSVLAGSPWAARLLKDWHMSGGLTAGSGMPLTARVLGNQADAGGTGAVGSARADATGQSVDSGSGYFNLAAFAVPPSGRFGNAGRNTIPGPGLFSMNLALSRTIELGDRYRLEFRAESANFLNHVSITSFATVVNASNYGLATAAQPMRTLTFSTRFRF